MTWRTRTTRLGSGTREHQNEHVVGKRDDFERADLAALRREFRPQKDDCDRRRRSSGLHGRHVAAVRGGSGGGGAESPANRRGAPGSAGLTVGGGSRRTRRRSTASGRSAHSPWTPGRHRRRSARAWGSTPAKASPRACRQPAFLTRGRDDRGGFWPRVHTGTCACSRPRA